MTAPAYSPADTPNTTAFSATDSYAFNTVGTSARIAGGGPYTLTTEPPRVGVGLAHGGVQVVKTLDGDAAAEYAPDAFPVTLSCTSAGQNVPLPADVAGMTLTPDTPVTVYDLPYHATCILADDGDSGQTSSGSTTATVQREIADFETVTLTNTYDYASLAITKAVESIATDQDGNPIPYGPFTVETTCTFLGAPVYAAGYGRLRPMTADLSDGQTITYTGLPAGAACTVTETDDKGAASTTIVTTAGSDDPVSTDGTSAPIELAPDTSSTANTAVITNAFDVGAINLVKQVTGDVADVYGAGPFILALNCTLDDATGSRTVWDGTVTLGAERR
ncbi:DUF5979 domain-containing protein [Microbacterium elymi]|uniref:DUF5979 domain-containing protein n=1 Tax=Microbacterium elymi TaxID=2909587 RepID=A0ABY5NIG3_9MICO|nr:DUF5979 domain-containing protein [Microbacterium elymi]UUT34970.1 DUF5979 domain-containing protein [Microbacterium elymi]